MARETQGQSLANEYMTEDNFVSAPSSGFNNPKMIVQSQPKIGLTKQSGILQKCRSQRFSQMLNTIGVSRDESLEEIHDRRSVTFDLGDEEVDNKISKIKIELPKSEQVSI